MPGYGFSLTRILSYKGRIVDSILIRENAGQCKPVFWHILHGNRIQTHCNAPNDALIETVECNNEHYISEAVTSSLTQV